MTWQLALVLALGVAAALWALVLRRRLRDWRLGSDEVESRRAEAEREKRAAELALGRSERRYRSLFEESQDAIYISTPGGRLVDINPAGVELFGFDSREELLTVDIGRDLYCDPRDRESSLDRLARDGALRDHELMLKRRDGSELRVVESATAIRDEQGEVLAYQGILRDVTGRWRLEEELRASQRMQAVGRLAGGIAHEFNNLLTVINGQTELIQAGLEPDDPLFRELGEIRSAGRRATALTHQLLILSRRRSGRREVLDLNRALSERQGLVRQVVGRDVEVELRLAAELGPVQLDPGLLDQLLLDLALNARQAMDGAGRLTIETRAGEIAADTRPVPAGLQPGDCCVCLRIEDTGKGVDEAARAHLFEPFFASGSGGEAGLALATVYGIVEQSGGVIRVDSEPGRGTAFEILLPEVAAEPALAEQRLRADKPATGGTVLLAEDEMPVRNLLREYLVAQGYRVLEAADGDEALEIARRAGGEIDLLLADVVMPGMRGSDLAQHLAETRPGIKVLLMSGYADVPVTPAAGSEPGRTEFIQKPFSTEMLGVRIRDLLHG